MAHSLVGGGDAVFPAEVEVRYRGTPVPEITSSTIWIWNAGKKTVRGSDIVANYPLQLRFDGEVSMSRSERVSREAVQISADTSGEVRRTVRYSFEFLDPGDGGVLEVLHTGSDEAPEWHWDHHWLSKGTPALGIRLGLFRFFQAGKKSPSVFVHHDGNCRTGSESTGNPRRTVHQRSSSLSRRTTGTTTALLGSCTVRVIGIFSFGGSCVEPTTSITFIVRCCCTRVITECQWRVKIAHSTIG